MEQGSGVGRGSQGRRDGSPEGERMSRQLLGNGTTCAGLLAGAAVALGLAIGAVTPAAAADDGSGSMFGSILSTITGVGKSKDVDLPIDYRERAPLVVPPNDSLPPPEANAAVRNPAWPRDPDIAAYKRAKALERAPAPLPGNGADKISNAELMRGRVASREQTAPVPMQCDSLLQKCGDAPGKLWNSLKTKKADSDTTVLLQPGVEPPREYLTQPPPGYLTPTKKAKYSFDAPSSNFGDDNLADAAKYYRDQGRHKTSVDE
jgi:hypothetical protein